MSTSVAALAQRINSGLGDVLVGSERMAFALELALFARGHLLIEGVPGTGKTLLVRTLALLLGLPFRRIQFTPDLMPADVVGTTVFNPQTAEFSTRPGPIMANVVLADEINRTPPKTQAALLEAMEEGRVTIDGAAQVLPEPFILCATQNPLEYEGTYPLPEAQLDRFFVKVTAGYPQTDQELLLLARAAGGFAAHALERSGIGPVATGAEILQAQAQVRAVHVSTSMQRYVYDVIAATRNSAQLALGASPRAALSLLLASQVAAAIDGRDYATPDDLKDVAQLVLAHRLIVHAHAEIEGRSAQEILDGVLSSVPVPRETATATS
ncbi:MAG: MoxR family ATPase [Candidatus Eremiobacteraeota bacterium]|nr:MoxR family ATPase [Candidatus Eremiobacteraeota bacterium]